MKFGIFYDYCNVEAVIEKSQDFIPFNDLSNFFIKVIFELLSLDGLIEQGIHS